MSKYISDETLKYKFLKLQLSLNYEFETKALIIFHYVWFIPIWNKANIIFCGVISPAHLVIADVGRIIAGPEYRAGAWSRAKGEWLEIQAFLLFFWPA